MICTHCGKEIADDAIFCSQCGSRLVPETPVKPEAPAEPEEVPAPEVEEKAGEAADIWPKAASIPAAPAAAAAVKTEPEAPRKPFLEEMQWDVSEYPDSNVIEKTDDIDFNWNTDPDKVEDPVPKAVVRPRPTPKETAPKSAESIRVSEIFDRVVPAQEARAAVKAQTEAPEEADGLDLSKFNTFNRKNAEFQQLLDKEYEKILDSGTIGKEQSQADAIAEERFDSRQEEMTMDQFLEKEGAVKRYEPEPLQSDVLMRIEAQEKKRAKEKAEEEARAKAAEEARAAAEAQKKAEIEQRNNEAEASAAAAEEIRLAEEAEIRQRTEEAAKQKAAEEAAHLAAIAERQAEAERRALEEKERKAAEEARLKAEAEQKAKEEAEARAKAELEAARAAEEEARKRAEAELNAAREAARIRAQEEASLAAQEEAKFQEARDRAQYEEEAQRQQARQDRADAVEAQVKDALAQTARMREEEEAKIKAALAGIRGGRFTNTIAAGETMEEPEKPEKQEEVVVPTVQEAPAAAIPSVEDLLGQDHEPDLPEADQIEEAHQATRDQIDEMAKAREDFFADFPDADEMVSRAAEKAAPAQTRMVSKDDLLAGLDNTKKMSRDALHLEGEEDKIEAAADEAKEMAEAAAADTAEAAGEAADAAQTAAADAGQTDFTGKLSEIDALLNQF
ncbi:MAG: zinc ribbon domain-containing protein, partial [bacterium]|nr:zinc ribbon domain-containing protein [bacterium]